MKEKRKQKNRKTERLTGGGMVDDEPASSLSISFSG